jgi:hypothetical protein
LQRRALRDTTKMLTAPGDVRRAKLMHHHWVSITNCTPQATAIQFSSEISTTWMIIYAVIRAVWMTIIVKQP